MTKIVNLFEKALNADTIDYDTPVVVHSALWGLLRVANEKDPNKLSCDLIDVLAKHFNKIFMPTFTSGYNEDNICDLDILPSQCRLMSETFRKKYATSRSLSAFFSFSALGYAQTELDNIRPENVWGAGSLYEWFETKNIIFLTLGLNISHLSYMHRFEWLYKDKLANKRFVKHTSGTIIRNNNSIPIQEKLFVRREGVVNDFTVFDSSLNESALIATDICGIPLQLISIDMVKKVVENYVTFNPGVMYA
jgi:aminoglycoside N3'-acetyltransferase